MRSEPKPADEAIAERKTVRTVLFEVSTRESKVADCSTSAKMIGSALVGFKVGCAVGTGVFEGAAVDVGERVVGALVGLRVGILGPVGARVG